MKGNNSLIAVVVVAIVAIAAVMYGAGMFSTAGNQVDENGDGVVDVCAGDITPKLTVNGYDIDNVGTAITENFAYRKVGSVSWTTGTLGTAIDNLELGKSYEIVTGIDKDNGIDNPYGEKFTYEVKCKEVDTVDKGLYNDEVEASLSATFYNADGDASAESFSAGESQVVSIKFKAGNDEVFGNPNIDNPNVLVLKLNSTEHDVPNSVYLSDGTELARISVPLRYDIEGLTASGFSTYAYEAPAITDKTTEIMLDLNADDSNAPSVDGTAYLYAGTYFIDNDGNVANGVEDEDGADIGTSDPDSVTIDLTA